MCPLGPPFSHPAVPYKSHFIGAITPRSSPTHYITCIQALLQTYHLELRYPPDTSLIGQDTRISSTIPLVINTHGWVKGLGADLLQRIEDAAGLTHLFSFDAPIWNTLDASVTRSEDILIPSPTLRTHVLSPIPPSPLSTKFTPADLRIFATLSYLHAVFLPSQSIALTWSASLPLCKREPWEVTTSDALDAVIIIGSGGEDVVLDELPRALNCGLVGLVRTELKSLDAGGRSTESIPYEQGALPPSPFESECIGLGVVRAVSTTARTLHLISPVPAVALSKGRVLVKGEMELPIWGMLDHLEQDGVCGVEWNKVPYLQWGVGVGAGASKRRIRRNVMRRGQM